MAAALLSTLLSGLALLHVYWAIAGVSAGAAVRSRPDGMSAAALAPSLLAVHPLH